MINGIVGSALSSMSYGRMLATIVWACIAALATAAGIMIVGVGGGMIDPMRQRMERMLTRPSVRRRTRRAASRPTSRAVRTR